ncbi:MAG: ABC transporter permease subunit [Planctomycetia bacterium]
MASSTPSSPPLSLWQLRLRRFRRLKRGWYSFLFLTTLYLLSFLLPFVMNNRAVVVHYQGKNYYPAAATYWVDTFGSVEEYFQWFDARVGDEVKRPPVVAFLHRLYQPIGSSWIFEHKVYQASEFGQLNAKGEPLYGEADYRALRKQFAAAGADDWVVMPVYPFGPIEQDFEEKENPPNEPSGRHWLGTDDRGRDILVRLAYGFRISISFALLVTAGAFTAGIVVGGVLGYCGGWIDSLGVRFIEIWGSVPFLYTVIILSSMLKPSFLLLVFILSAFGWIGVSYYVRGEFLREKGKEYVAAAVAVGETHRSIIFRHILPNALTPVISIAPFAIVAEISALAALDFLGFGLPAPTPSWGELIGEGKNNFREWHLVVFPLLAIVATLQLIVFIGEAVREAMDPKVYSRLK